MFLHVVAHALDAGTNIFNQIHAFEHRKQKRISGTADPAEMRGGALKLQRKTLSHRNQFTQLFFRQCLHFLKSTLSGENQRNGLPPIPPIDLKIAIERKYLASVMDFTHAH